MRKGVGGLAGCQVAFFDGAFEHGADGSKSVEGFQFAPPHPAQYGWAVDEKYPLNLRGEGRIEKTNETFG